MEKHDAQGSGSSAWMRFAPLAVIALLLAGAWETGLLEYFSLSSFLRNREWLAGLVEANFVLSLAAYMLVYAGLVAISFPGASLLTITAGFLFGGLAGGIATVAAATAGASAVFLAARSSLGPVLENRASGFLARFAEGFREDAFSYLLSLRLMPVFPFWVVNIAPGLLNMKLRPYVLATFLGIIPGTLAFAFVGAGLGSVIDAQEAANPGCAAAGTCTIDVSSLVTPQLLAAFAALGLVALLPAIVHRIRGARASGK